MSSTSQAVSLGGHARDEIKDLTVRLQHVCVEYLEQYRAAVIAQVPTSLAGLHVAEEGRLESGSDHSWPRVQESLCSFDEKASA